MHEMPNFPPTLTCILMAMKTIPKGKNMKTNALVVPLITLSICFGMPVQKASSTGGVEQTTMKMLAGQGRATDDRGPISADINDSDEFFQNAVRPGPERDNTQKIEALLKRMTLEEKVGQMTQLTLG